MRALIPLLLVLAACRYSEEKFSADFGQKMCDTIESDACHNGVCDPGGVGEDPVMTGDFDGCRYDPKKARDCVKAEWRCVNLGGGLMFPDVPESCAAAYTCPEVSP